MPEIIVLLAYNYTRALIMSLSHCKKNINNQDINSSVYNTVIYSSGK